MRCSLRRSRHERCTYSRSTATGAFNGSIVGGATSSALTQAAAQTLGIGSGGGGGGGGWSSGPMTTIGNLTIYEAEAAAAAAAVTTMTPTTVSIPYSATRSYERIVAIQAFCLDDKDIPHPASQVMPGREVDQAYEGELYRCIAGARMQYVLAEYKGEVSFAGAQTMLCAKGEALYHAAGGQVACRPQKPSRDCNERSLLRRYGAGIKILKLIVTETYTAYRTEAGPPQYQTQPQAQATARAEISTGSIVLDGGVGGIQN